MIERGFAEALGVHVGDNLRIGREPASLIVNRLGGPLPRSSLAAAPDGGVR